MLVLTSGVTLAQPAAESKSPPAIESPAVVAAPPLGGWIDIWVDNVNNYNAAVAYNSRHGEYLVVWEDDRAATREIHARRVARNGALKGEFIVVSKLNKMNWLPDVAYSAAQDEYLIVYTYNLSTTDYDIWARRVRWDGSWMSAELPISMASGKQWYPAVAYNSRYDEYLVVYENYWSDPTRDISAQRVKASNGSLVGSCNIASDVNKIRRMPDVAYNAARNEYLIAYTYQTAPLGDADIRGKISDASMSTLSSEIQITIPGSPPQENVALAAGPDEYLVVWDEDYGVSQAGIWGRRVGGTGTLHSFINLASDAGLRRVEPAVGFGDSGRYLVTWRFLAGTHPAWDIYGRTVRMGQDSPEGAEFVVDATSGWQRAPAVGCALSGPCLIAYEDDWPDGLDFEIRGRLAGYQCAFLPVVLRKR